MAELVNNLHDVANSPLMRFGNRSMQALDGFVGSFVAVAEAKRSLGRLQRERQT